MDDIPEIESINGVVVRINNTETALTRQFHRLKRSHMRMMEGLEVINGVSEYIRGEATLLSQSTDNLRAQNANGLNPDAGSAAGDVERVNLRPLKRLKKGEKNPSDDGRTSDEGESLEAYLKRCCNRVKEGVDVICNVSEYVYKEESLKVSADVDENKKLEEDILEKQKKEGSLEEGMITFACPVCYPVIEQEEGAEDNDDKHIVEAKKVNGVVVNITCTCGTQYQILFTDDSVCIPVPLSTVELNSEVDIPNAIWARKYNGHTVAGLECYYCKREITFDKVGENLQCYIN